LGGRAKVAFEKKKTGRNGGGDGNLIIVRRKGLVGSRGAEKSALWGGGKMKEGRTSSSGERTGRDRRKRRGGIFSVTRTICSLFLR